MWGGGGGGDLFSSNFEQEIQNSIKRNIKQNPNFFFLNCKKRSEKDKKKSYKICGVNKTKKWGVKIQVL